MLIVTQGMACLVTWLAPLTIQTIHAYTHRYKYNSKIHMYGVNILGMGFYKEKKKVILLNMYFFKFCASL